MACGVFPTTNFAADCDGLIAGINGNAAYFFNFDDFTITATGGVLTFASPTGTFVQLDGTDTSVTLMSEDAGLDGGLNRYKHTFSGVALTYADAVKNALYNIRSQRIGVIVKRNDGTYVAGGIAAIDTTVKHVGLKLTITDNPSENMGGLKLDAVTPDGVGEIAGLATLWTGAKAFIEGNLPA